MAHAGEIETEGRRRFWSVSPPEAREECRVTRIVGVPEKDAAGLKALLEHDLVLNLVPDRFPDGLEEQ